MSSTAAIEQRRSLAMPVAANSIENNNKQADCKQRRVNKEEIYNHFECERDLLDQDSNSAVGHFYQGRTVLITGASGFVGKCLLEKLLRSCPGLHRVYILLRPKRGLDIDERLERLLDSELFERLRALPNSARLLAKVRPIRGDITEPMLGLSEADVRLLSAQVSLVIHSAATVKFAEPLKAAVLNNVVSVANLVELAARLAKLDALVHVSTAYSNCDRRTVDETFYEAPIEADKLIDMARWMDADMFERLAPALLGPRPNTYTFTKAVAEALLARRAQELLPRVPIAMVRPSIVGGTWRQPLRGWVDNFNGPTGVILAMATGALQAMPVRTSYCADIVPVDVVANLIICATYKICAQQNGTNTGNISIFNCVSSTLNPINWGEILSSVKRISDEYPVNKPLRQPSFMLMSNERLFSVYNFFSHKCVAHLADFALQLLGQKGSLVSIYKRLDKMVATLRPFTMNQWLFKCANVTSLFESLSPVDRRIFNFDVRQVAWDDYIRRYYVGSKTFALKDDPNSLSSARRKRTRMKTSTWLAQMLLLVVAYCLLVSQSTVEQYLLQSIDFLLPAALKCAGQQQQLDRAA